METISLKLDENLLENIDSSLPKHNFSTRTEFIREAIRDKLKQLSYDERIQAFLDLKGKAKKTSDKARNTNKDKASKEIEAYLNKKFNL